jgi:hypothetical protein
MSSPSFGLGLEQPDLAVLGLRRKTCRVEDDLISPPDVSLLYRCLEKGSPKDAALAA